MPVSTHPQKDRPIVMTVHEVAEYLRVSEAKVYRLVKEHRIPVIRLGKTWRFRKDLIDDWFLESTESRMKSKGN